MLAARIGTPTNSIYTGWMVKDCKPERAWGRAPHVEPGVLSVLNREMQPAIATAEANGVPPLRVPLGWGTACSTQPLP